MRATYVRPIDLKIARRLLIMGSLVTSFALVAALPLMGQVPVAIMEEAGRSDRQLTQARLAPDLSWEQTRRILSEQGLQAPYRPPSQFTLTPRAPYRFPGGHIRLSYGGTTSMSPYWRPDEPSPTGGIRISRSVHLEISLSRMRPNTQYLLDMSMDDVGMSAKELTVWQDCRTGLNPSSAGRFNVRGPQHVFVVMPTDNAGNGCYRLTTKGGAWLLKVDVAELGPAP